MNPLLDALATLLTPTIVLLHLYVAPFTKVEESFNIQATRDVLASGIPFTNVREVIASQYDHAEFPGAVPRTFVGAVALAAASSPWLRWVTGGLALQVAVRGTLGLFNSYALLSYRNAVSKTFGQAAGLWYILLQASQFHVMFYASRTLPNMFAFGLTTFAMKYYLLSLSPTATPKHLRLCLMLLTASAVIFRAEIALLLYTTVTVRFLMAMPHMSGDGRSFLEGYITAVGAMVFPILMALAVALPLTLAVDTYLWPPHRPNPYPLWPEAMGFIFNTIEGKSSDWGVMPWHYYLTSSIPRLLLNPLAPFLIFVSITAAPTAPVRAPGKAPNAPGTPTATTTAALILPSLAFIAIYSLLPHKEWRFIIYALPTLTTAAAVGATAIWNVPVGRSHKGRNIARTALLASILAAFALSSTGLLISSLNYPGGTALARLKSYVDAGALPLDNPHNATLKVFADNLACQTGVTRFLVDSNSPDAANAAPALTVIKTDTPELFTLEHWSALDFALVESPERALGNWEVLDVVWSFAGVELVRPASSSSSSSSSSSDEDDWPKSRSDAFDVQAALKARASGRRAREAAGLELEKAARGVDVAIERGLWKVLELWGKAESALRVKVLRGWWVRARMEPRVWVLGRGRGVGLNDQDT